METINGTLGGGIFVDLVIVSLIIFHAFWGYKRGLTALIFKIFIFIVSLLIMFILYKPVANLIITNTTLDETLIFAIEKNLTNATWENGNLLHENTNVSKSVTNLMNSFAAEAFKQAETDVAHYVSVQLAYKVIEIGTMILLFIIARCLLLFIKFATEIVSNLPILKTFNQIGGLVCGVIKGLLLVYMILTILSILSPLI